MEIVCIDKQTFEELRERFCKLEEKVTRICRPVEDLGLKKWLDNQEVCEVLRISKKTLQVYRDKGILPYSRIKHKIFFKTEDVHKLLESNYHHSYLCSVNSDWHFFLVREMSIGWIIVCSFAKMIVHRQRAHQPLCPPLEIP